MGKFKPAGSKRKAKLKDVRSALPCLIIIVLGTLMLFMLLYAIMKG